MMNKRQRHLLHDLEHELEREDPTWFRQFGKTGPSSTPTTRLLLDASLGFSVLIMAIGLLLGLTGVVGLFGMAATALVTYKFRR
jgi:hypothetical protein